MGKYMIYKKNTGEIIHEHYGWPTELDPLTEERQREIIESIFPDKFYDLNMVVDVGHNAVKFRDVMSSDEFDTTVFIGGKSVTRKRAVKVVNHKKVKDITGKRR